MRQHGEWRQHGLVVSFVIRIHAGAAQANARAKAGSPNAPRLLTRWSLAPPAIGNLPWSPLVLRATPHRRRDRKGPPTRLRFHRDPYAVPLRSEIVNCVKELRADLRSRPRHKGHPERCRRRCIIRNGLHAQCGNGCRVGDSVCIAAPAWSYAILRRRLWFNAVGNWKQQSARRERGVWVVATVDHADMRGLVTA